jgi:hypothetical protein
MVRGSSRYGRRATRTRGPDTSLALRHSVRGAGFGVTMPESLPRAESTTVGGRQPGVRDADAPDGHRYEIA